MGLSFQQLSDELGKTLVDLATKKETLNKATNAVLAASEDYNNAVNYAQDIKKQMNDLLNDAIPTNVKVTPIRA